MTPASQQECVGILESLSVLFMNDGNDICAAAVPAGLDVWRHLHYSGIVRCADIHRNEMSRERQVHP